MLEIKLERHLLLKLVGDQNIYTHCSMDAVDYSNSFSRRTINISGDSQAVINTDEAPENFTRLATNKVLVLTCKA